MNVAKKQKTSSEPEKPYLADAKTPTRLKRLAKGHDSDSVFEALAANRSVTEVELWECENERVQVWRIFIPSFTLPTLLRPLCLMFVRAGGLIRAWREIRFLPLFVAALCR